MTGPRPVDITALSDALVQGDDGVWYGQTSPRDYPDEGHGHCWKIEDRSFWFRHRAACLLAVLERWPPPRGPLVDLGGGNGHLTRRLAEAGWPAVLVEPGPVGVANAQARGVSPIVCASITDTRFRERSMAGIGLFDVIEHIEDDRAFLAESARLLHPRGRMYLTVPAYPILWSHSDEEALHHRRYTARSLSAALTAAGLDVEFLSGFFLPLVPAIAVARSLPWRFGWTSGRDAAVAATREHGAEGGPAVDLIARVLAPEVTWLRSGRRLPLGASLVAVARHADQGETGSSVHRSPRPATRL